MPLTTSRIASREVAESPEPVATAATVIALRETLVEFILD
jgi:hypothetical protein